MNHTKSFKIGASLALISILSIAMIAAAAQSYALPSQANTHNAGKEKENNENQIAPQTQVSEDKDQKNTPKGLALGHQKNDAKSSVQEKIKQAFSMSSVIIGKNTTGDNSFITVLTKRLKEVTIEIVNATKITKNSGTDPNLLTMISRLAIGDRVLIKTTVNSNATITATKIVAGTQGQLNAAGNVTGITSNSLTIKTRSGQNLVLTATTTPTSPLYTVVKENKTTLPFSNVAIGDHIQTTFTVQPNGTLDAIIIHINSK